MQKQLFVRAEMESFGARIAVLWLHYWLTLVSSLCGVKQACCGALVEVAGAWGQLNGLRQSPAPAAQHRPGLQGREQGLTGGRIVSRSQVQGLQVPGTWEELILIHRSGCTISFWPSSGYNKVLGPGILMTVNMRGMSSEDLVAYVCHGWDGGIVY